MSELTRQSTPQEVRSAGDGYALDFLDELARDAGGTEVLDFQWGLALGRALEHGWRVLPPRLAVAADTILEEDLDHGG